MTGALLPVHVQVRASANVGTALSNLLTALPVDWRVVIQRGTDDGDFTEELFVSAAPFSSCEPAVSDAGFLASDPDIARAFDSLTADLAGRNVE